MNKEQVTSDRPIRALVFCAKHLPLPVVAFATALTSAVYYFFSPVARRECRAYQRRLIDYKSKLGSFRQAQCTAFRQGGASLLRERGRLHILRQIASFALCVTEKVEGWLGKIHLEDIAFHEDGIISLKNDLEAGRGAFIITSHLGNAEMLRSLAAMGHTGVARSTSVTIIMDKTTTQKFNRALDEISDTGLSRQESAGSPPVLLPASCEGRGRATGASESEANSRSTQGDSLQKSGTEVIAADSIGVDTIMLLMDKISNGGMVVIAGDRFSSENATKPMGHSRRRATQCEFLGKTALFPYGAFLLPALLKTTPYFIFALRKKDFMWHSKYDMFVHKSSVTFDNAPRYQREERIKALSLEFVRLLEGYCLRYPFQWYNFYDFWCMENGGEK